MLDIIGNIKVDESKPERVKSLFACLRSYEFLKDVANFQFTLVDASPALIERFAQECKQLWYKFVVHEYYWQSRSYASQYLCMLQYAQNPYVLNFMEDQFMLCDSVAYMEVLLLFMKKHNVDLLKTSFFQVEQNSCQDIQEISGTEYELFKNLYGKIFVNNEENFKRYQKYYGTRYYIGVNFLTTRDFAFKFWSRDLGPRPHEYEIVSGSEKWLHTAMIPKFEVQAAVDDDHGEPGTCMLARKEPKFLKLYDES